uniref:Uncharacterized protein n=1 Tax=Cannabis sativa TaxID=3483 RepID=A0A803QVV3_CANSA
MVEEKKEEEEIIDYWWNIVVELVIKIVIIIIIRKLLQFREQSKFLFVKKGGCLSQLLVLFNENCCLR